MKRTETRPIQIGGVQIGGQNKVIIQSMTNTKTKDVEATVSQIKRLEEAGCEIIRTAVPNLEAVKLIPAIKELVPSWELVKKR